MLRKEMTHAEMLLWDKLRDQRLCGLKFRRQQPIGRFIVDFYCASARIDVAIDGQIHDTQKGCDLERTSELEAYGYQIIRFRNEEVESEIEKVLSAITAYCQPPHPSPLPESGEEKGQGMR